MDSQRFVVQGFGYNQETDERAKEFLIETLPRTPYYYLKLVEFKGGRIDYIFSPRRKVLETFEDKIFNVIGWKKGKEVIHTRHDLADMVATSILNHKMNQNDYEIFNSIFPEFKKIEYIYEVIENSKPREYREIECVLRSWYCRTKNEIYIFNIM